MANPFVHIELSSTDPVKAKAFFKKVFDWKLEDMPMGPGMTYTMLGVGKGTGGGIQKTMEPGAPSAWLAYVEVDSVAATVAKAKKAGANVVVDYQIIPGMGAFGVFVDPTGAHLGVWEQPKKAAKAAKKAAPKRKAKAKPKAKKVAKKR